MTDQLSGVIERITFHNIDNGYCVLRVRARGQRELVTVVGTLQHPVAGEYVEAAGKWVTDRQHGLQFKADHVKTTPPHTAEGIAKYLGSGLVRGVGPGYARRIVDVFGDKTLEVIDQSPTFLTQVKGIGPKLVEKIRDSWREQQAVRSIMVFLHSYGIGTARAVRIYRQYGENAIELVRSNPYRLSTDIWGVGFQTADELALKLGLPRDSPFRAQAAVRHVLHEAQSDGHVGLPEELAAQAAETLTDIAPEGIRDAVEQLRITDEIVRDSLALVTNDAGVHREPVDDLIPADAQLLYLKPLFLAELGVARQLGALAKGSHPLQTADHTAALAWAEKKMGITFADSQRRAVTEAVTHKLMVVTGGPGTGKTTIVRAILEIVSAKALRVLLAAPTGRAAKRLAESTGREAKTIHRLLEFDPGIAGFRRGKENPLDVDVLVVDETSMVDVVLMNRLLQAIPPFAAVVFVGDVDQLPSVGAGAVLADLIASGVVPVARLTEVHRQAGASWIVRAAHAVNHGDQPESAPAGKGDFYFVEADTPEAVIDKLRQMVTARIPAAFGLDPLRDVQVLTPQVKTELGVTNLNKVLQEALNPPRPGTVETRKFDTAFRAGDKVLQVRNNYQREVFNGDIGRVSAIDAVEQVVTVDFDGRPVEYDFADLDELQLAYAVTIHKCVAGYGRAAVAGRGLVPVREVTVGDAIQTGRGGTRRVLDRVETGAKPIVRVRTRNGYEIDVSAEHPLLVATADQLPHFRRAGELEPGVFACLDRSVVTGGPVELPPVVYDTTRHPPKRVAVPTVLTEEFAWGLGVIVGDGCCRDRRDGMVDVTSQDAAVIEPYRALFAGMGLAVTVRPTGNHTRAYFCSVPFRRWLEQLGLGHDLGPDEVVPRIVFGADPQVRGAFLRGLFDTDGSAGRINVRFTTSSPRLAREVQELLLSLGIVSTRASQNDRHYKVTVSGTALPVFAERVGFTVERKRERLTGLLARCGRAAGKTNRDVIPFGATLLREVSDLIPRRRGVTGAGLFAHGSRVGSAPLAGARRSHQTNYTHLARADDLLTARGLAVPEVLQATRRENYFFDPVVAVERRTDETEMYDLEVDDHHSFVVNGFVCHNSQGSEYPAVVVPVSYQHYVMLQRNLIYTAITRGRKLVVLVGSRKALWRAVTTADTRRRFGLLRWRLQNLMSHR